MDEYLSDWILIASVAFAIFLVKLRSHTREVTIFQTFQLRVTWNSKHFPTELEKIISKYHKTETKWTLNWSITNQNSSNKSRKSNNLKNGCAFRSSSWNISHRFCYILFGGFWKTLTRVIFQFLKTAQLGCTRNGSLGNAIVFRLAENSTLNFCRPGALPALESWQKLPQAFFSQTQKYIYSLLTNGMTNIVNFVNGRLKSIFCEQNLW